ncbi:hypothetical protein DNU06_13635 [Putridiphycobacter roseus]|uniref:Uncharacterized protein n=1 Tax=Putridiphycobacter roseus TaxID=2219161 RepID=A0A2W1MYQ1_9FLAO|nr:hypothetical protein [Putridiphycobacter roseus]PZE16350.1 hypothetical protein DNU06_13635 [Putridiphycobacter roseus]
MSSKSNKLTAFIKTISDLKYDYFEGLALSRQERRALKAFDKYRLEALKSSQGHPLFSQRFLEIRHIEHTLDYREFIK